MQQQQMFDTFLSQNTQVVYEPWTDRINKVINQIHLISPVQLKDNLLSIAPSVPYPHYSTLQNITGRVFNLPHPFIQQQLELLVQQGKQQSQPLLQQAPVQQLQEQNQLPKVPHHQHSQYQTQPDFNPVVQNDDEEFFPALSLLRSPTYSMASPSTLLLSRRGNISTTESSLPAALLQSLPGIARNRQTEQHNSPKTEGDNTRGYGREEYDADNNRSRHRAPTYYNRLDKHKQQQAQNDGWGDNRSGSSYDQEFVKPDENVPTSDGWGDSPHREVERGGEQSQRRDRGRGPYRQRQRWRMGS